MKFDMRFDGRSEGSWDRMADGSRVCSENADRSQTQPHRENADHNVPRELLDSRSAGRSPDTVGLRESYVNFEPGGEMNS